LLLSPSLAAVPRLPLSHPRVARLLLLKRLPLRKLLLLKRLLPLRKLLLLKRLLLLKHPLKLLLSDWQLLSDRQLDEARKSVISKNGQERSWSFFLFVAYLLARARAVDATLPT
jgi:hypothetical protein